MDGVTIELQLSSEDSFCARAAQYTKWPKSNETQRMRLCRLFGSAASWPRVASSLALFSPCTGISPARTVNSKTLEYGFAALSCQIGLPYSNNSTLGMRTRRMDGRIWQKCRLKGSNFDILIGSPRAGLLLSTISVDQIIPWRALQFQSVVYSTEFTKLKRSLMMRRILIVRCCDDRRPWYPFPSYHNAIIFLKYLPAHNSHAAGH